MKKILKKIIFIKLLSIWAFILIAFLASTVYWGITVVNIMKTHNALREVIIGDITIFASQFLASAIVIILALLVIPNISLKKLNG